MSPSMQRIIAALTEHGAMDADQIADKACTTKHSFIAKYRTLLLDADQIHISEYRRNPRGGWPIPIYGLGPGKEPKKPNRVSKAESNRRWLAKQAIPKPDRMLAILAGL